MWSGCGLAFFLHSSLDLSTLASLNMSGVSSGQGLQIFINGIATQSEIFNAKFRAMVLQFWEKAVRERSFPEGFVERVVNWHQGVDKCLDGKDDWLMKKGVPELHLQNLRIGIDPLY